MQRLFTILLVALVAGACATNQPESESAPGAVPVETIPAAAVGLNHHSFFDTAQPPPAAAPAPSTNEAKVIPAAFEGSPPVIPHTTADMFPITLEDNVCLDCHDRANAAEENAPPIPADHYLDLRNAPKKPRGKIAGARYNCHACHLPRTDAKPLVPNTFTR